MDTTVTLMWMIYILLVATAAQLMILPQEDSGRFKDIKMVEADSPYFQRFALSRRAHGSQLSVSAHIDLPGSVSIPNSV